MCILYAINSFRLIFEFVLLIINSFDMIIRKQNMKRKTENNSLVFTETIYWQFWKLQNCSSGDMIIRKQNMKRKTEERQSPFYRECLFTDLNSTTLPTTLILTSPYYEPERLDRQLHQGRCTGTIFTTAKPCFVGLFFI